MRGTRAAVAWIACFAFLLATLAPSFSQAMQRGAADAWTEVCTALGAKLVSVDGGAKDGSTPAAPAKHLLQHCPYCTLNVTVLGMPPTPLSVLSLVPLGFALPELLLTAPRTLFAWTTAQPRAPPGLS